MYFLYQTLETKISQKKQIIAGLFFIALRMGYYNMNFGYRPYFAIVICTFYSSLVFSGTINKYIIWSITAIVLDGIVETWVSGIYILIPNTDIIYLDSTGIMRLVGIIVSKLMLFFLYYLSTRKIDKASEIGWKYSILLVIFPIGCFVIVYILFIYTDKLIGDDTKPLIFLVSNVLLIMIYSVIALYNGLIADAKKLNMSNLKLKTIELTKSHSYEVSSIYDKISKIKHDLHNHFAIINGYIKLEKFDSLSNYMKKLGQFDFDISLYSNQPIINTLMNSFVYRAKNENVEFTFKIQLPETLSLTDVEICILFSNILDNAFEANRLLNGHRYVNLTVSVDKFYWHIHCQNPNYTINNLKTSNALKSTKKSNDIHGIGTQQIKEIAESKNGCVIFNCEGYKFSTVVMIKIN